MEDASRGGDIKFHLSKESWWTEKNLS